MKRKSKVKGYSLYLKMDINKMYYEDEIFFFNGKQAELNGSCICVANRARENPRFKEGEFTVEEIK